MPNNMSVSRSRGAAVIGSNHLRAFLMSIVQPYDGCHVLQLLLFGDKACVVWRRDMAAVFSNCLTTPNNISKMEELKELTAGQKAVVDAYIANYEPVDTFDAEECLLVDTQTMILEMDSMCNFDENMLCDYLVSKGYRAHYVKKHCLSGWIVKETD